MEKTLRATPFAACHILLTGATGYMGALIVASLLRDTAAQITCLTRPMNDRDALLASIIEEWEAQAHDCWSDAVESRVHQMKLPENLADVTGLESQLEGIDEIVHCAGCLDYYDIPKLQAVNVDYTAHLIVLARRLALKRFVYISTAYSSGYQPHVTAEALLPEPKSDPTQYTRTKRKAERLVATSGVPFLIIRPSILIGTSETGRYSGKRYGLYQQWMGLERLACDRYHPHFHTVAPELPLNLLHQDAFCHAFELAYHWLPNDAFMNLVSNPQTSPSMRDLWDMWFEVTRPQKIYYYASFDQVPFKEIPPRQRAYLTFAQVNLEIASHHWQFEATWLELALNIAVAFVAFVASFLVGHPLALGRMSRFFPLRWLCIGYIELVRSVPLLIVLFWFFFSIPILLHMTPSPLWTAFIALSAYASAYQAEYIRSGIKSVAAGEVEAARSLGLSASAVWLRVVLPQVHRRMLPTYASYFTSMFKDSSVLYLLGLVH